jgi:hypothetical protein
MMTKTKLALAAILVLGAGSLAQAASDNDGGNDTGGYRLLGPGGVVTDGVNPVYHRSLRGNAGNAYAYVPPHHTARKHTTTK